MKRIMYSLAVIPALVWGCVVVQDKPADSAPPAQTAPPPPPAAQPDAAPAATATATAADAGATAPTKPKPPRPRHVPKPGLYDAGTESDAATTDAAADATGD